MKNLDEEDIEKMTPNYVLFKATTAHNLPVMCQAMALGADKNWQNPENLDRSALHQSVFVVSKKLDDDDDKRKYVNFNILFPFPFKGSLMTCELLLLNGANINCIDRKGYTPLHLAIETENTALSYLLLKHKAKYDITTNDGKLPIDFAVQTAVNFK